MTTPASEGDGPATRFVGVGVGDYQYLPALELAVPGVNRVAGILRDRHHLAVAVVEGGSRNELAAALEALLPAGQPDHAGQGLVVLWVGHGVQGPNGELRLAGRTNRRDDSGLSVLTAQALGELAARSGARQILILLDTCHADASALDALAIARAVLAQRAQATATWFGVLAACQQEERARAGVFVDRLATLLTSGPDDPGLRLRWSPYNLGLRGDDLADALVKEWDEPRQVPQQTSTGDARPILRNPLFRPAAPDQVVEHLLLAARGADDTEEGQFFTGREAPLRKLVGWVRRATAGLGVVTGPAGCGKSAVVGRLVSLSSANERRAIQAAAGLPPMELDPGVGSVAAHAYLRGVTLERLVETLAGQLGVAGGPNRYELVGWAARQQVRPLLVVDGLDEAGVEGRRVAAELLVPLAAEARVLVASREVPGTGTDPSLLGLLGPPGLLIDLGADPDATHRDVHAYVVARLTGQAPRVMDPQRVADALTGLLHADRAAREGPFFLARIVTSQLRAEPVDTAAPAWQAALSGSVVEAFERDLGRGRPLVRDGVEVPQAAGELLGALAYAYGAGFPADDVWPVVASALSATGTGYDRYDAYWALGEYGRYIVAAGEAGQAVYRLAHQQLVDHLRRTEGAGPWRRVPEPTAARIAAALVAEYRRQLRSGAAPADHPYLWRYLWRHCSDGGAPGIQPLRQLATHNPALLGDLAGALNNLGARYGQVGRRRDAVAPTEEAVAIRRELARHDPAFRGDLAGALSNLGVRFNQVGRRGEAVAPTEEAVGLYRGLARDNPAFRGDLAMSLSNLGVRYSEVGRRGEAVAPAEEAVGVYRELARDNPAFRDDLAMSLNNLTDRYRDLDQAHLATAAWDQTMDSLADQPAAQATLLIRRRRPDDERHDTTADLATAIRLVPGDQPRLRFEAHQACRSRRANDLPAFDRTWQAIAGPPPGWLTLDPAVLDLAVAWLDTPSWTASKHHLTDQQAALLSEAGLLALDELALAVPDDPQLPFHRDLLARCRTEGLDAAYRPLLASELLDAWLAADDLAGFFSEHQAALLGDDVQAAISARTDEPAVMLVAAILELAHAGERQLVFRLLDEPALRTDTLVSARRQGNSERLRPVATIALAVAETDPEAAVALTHLAIASALASELDAAAEALQQARRLAPDIGPIMLALTDTLQHQPAHAAGLSRLVALLYQPEPEDEQDSLPEPDA